MSNFSIRGAVWTSGGTPDWKQSCPGMGVGSQEDSHSRSPIPCPVEGHDWVPAGPPWVAFTAEDMLLITVAVAKAQGSSRAGNRNHFSHGPGLS